MFTPQAGDPIRYLMQFTVALELLAFSSVTAVTVYYYSIGFHAIVHAASQPGDKPRDIYGTGQTNGYLK